MPKAGGVNLGHEVEKVGETEDEKSEEEEEMKLSKVQAGV